MAAIDHGVRSLELADLDWVLDLSAHRRELLAGFGPRLWRPAAEARTHHRAFLRQQLHDRGVLSLRTDHGFVIAAPGRAGGASPSRSPDWFDVDDLALDDDAHWPQDGAALLRAVNERGDLRFVCPVPERARRRAAEDLAMVLDESWWHRDLVAPSSPPATTPSPLATTPSPPAASATDVLVPGASGRLVDAPPVYAPGGPVLLIDEVDDGSALASIEAAAAARGAVVSVVSRRPGQPTGVLTAAGHARTTDFFVSGRPRGGTVGR